MVNEELCEKLTKIYLDKHYTRSQKPITVVYRPHGRVSWGKNRKEYEGNYDLHYNHRSILTNEVVFDFDEGNIKQNYKDVTTKLKSDQIGYESFINKNSDKEGIRLHTYWDFNRVKDKKLMKKLILKHYAYGKGIDYQLCGKHLIRCEYGYYEKEYPKQVYNIQLEEYNMTNLFDEEELNTIPKTVWEKYVNYRKNKAIKSYARSKGIKVNNKLIKKLLNNEVRVEDGRERILFYLIHQLKKDKTQKEVYELLKNWYHYNGGTKLAPHQIRYKIKYHWNRNYTFSPYHLENLLKRTGE